jgi:signal transduction histidine kinase
VVDPRPLDHARLTRHAIELTITRYQLPKEAIRCDGASSLMVAGDAQALETAVLNLLDNAVKYSRERVEIEVEVWGDADGQAHVRVRDHGIGMSRTHLPFIFTRFYRIGAEVRRSRTGTGLGLFIVRSIVKGHHGTIAADSLGPDRGSTFTISLPGLLEPDAEEAAEAARA